MKRLTYVWIVQVNVQLENVYLLKINNTAWNVQIMKLIHSFTKANQTINNMENAQNYIKLLKNSNIHK